MSCKENSPGRETTPLLATSWAWDDWQARWRTSPRRKPRRASWELKSCRSLKMRRLHSDMCMDGKIKGMHVEMRKKASLCFFWDYSVCARQSEKKPLSYFSLVISYLSLSVTFNEGFILTKESRLPSLQQPRQLLSTAAAAGCQCSALQCWGILPFCSDRSNAFYLWPVQRILLDQCNVFYLTYCTKSQHKSVDLLTFPASFFVQKWFGRGSDFPVKIMHPAGQLAIRTQVWKETTPLIVRYCGYLPSFGHQLCVPVQVTGGRTLRFHVSHNCNKMCFLPKDTISHTQLQ